MAAGSFYIRKNSAETDALPNAGTNLDVGWDTLHYDEGGIVTYSDPNLQLDIGLYLIMYNEYFYTADTTNNERIEIQGEIHTVAGGLQGGFGQDYIRKSDGDQEAVVQGSMYLQVTADNTDVFIRFYRTDDSTTGTVNRVVGKGGVTILQMDDATHNFGFASASAVETTSAATERSLTLNTNDKMDAGFSLASSQITVTTAGRYLIHYELDISQTGTGREVVNGFLRKNGTTEIQGTRAYNYLRGSDGTQDGALSWIGIVDLVASDSIGVQWVCPTDATITCLAGSGRLQMWEIPSGGDEAIMEATTGDYNADADFAWDTLPHIDTGSFTATAGTSNIDVDQNDHLLVFATFSQITDSTTQRAVPFLTIENNEVTYDYICGAAYHRNSATSNFGVGIWGLATLVKSGKSVEIHTEPIAATGALANTRGQFSVLSLESIWTYTYNFPPVITGGDTQIDNGAINLTITGEDFLTAQGDGQVEICDNIVYDSATVRVTQTIDGWADASIQYDSIKGALGDGTAWVFVTSDPSVTSNAWEVNLGRLSYTEIIAAITPAANKHWTFQNTYTDVIDGVEADGALSQGTPAFVTSPKLARGDTHSLELATGDGISPPDQTDMNDATHSRRYMGGWIQLDSVFSGLAVLYEEGAQVNNIAFLNGFGNALMLQVANASDDYVQTYAEKPIAVDRPTHIFFKFEASGFDAEVRTYIDGVLQPRSNGNPWETAQLDAHSGNITWGHEGTEALKVGDDRGVDATNIAFVSPNKCYYAHWANWTDVALDPSADIRIKLFEMGAQAALTITSDTQANMQIDISTYAVTERPDWPCAIRIDQVTGLGDLELTFDNITFNERCSIDVQWQGGPGEELTIIQENGSIIDTDKISSPYLGTVNIINAPTVTITCKDAGNASLIENARVLIQADTGGDLPYQDSVTISRTSSTATVTHTAHGLRTGLYVIIKGANEYQYNGLKLITVTDANTYTYLISTLAGATATGSVICTAVIVTGLTDVNGEITTNFRYTNNQPVVGKARHGTTPYFKQGALSASITSSGLNATILLIADN